MNIYTKAREIIEQITYKPGWKILLQVDTRRGTYMQVACTATVDADTGEPTAWKGGKRYLSEWMCKQELVGIAFELIRAAEEHELREMFKYQGAAIYGPHQNPDALVAFVSDPANIQCRKNAMTMEETS